VQPHGGSAHSIAGLGAPPTRAELQAHDYRY